MENGTVHADPEPRGATAVALLLLATLLIAGCGSYRLGPPQETPFQVLYVAAVTNESLAPQASALLTRELRNTFVRDGRVSLGEEARADAVLQVTLRDYRRESLATQPEDTALALSHEVEIVAHVTLRDSRKGHLYLDERIVRAGVQVPGRGDFTRAEYETLPVLAERLARQIVNQVLSAW